MSISFYLFLFIILVNNIPGIEEVNMIKDDGSVIHFNNPKVSDGNRNTHDFSIGLRSEYI